MLAQQLRRLLALFGINCILTTNMATGNRLSPGYALVVTTVQSKTRLVERIGFISERQRRLADAMVAGFRGHELPVTRSADAIALGEGCDLLALKELVLRHRRTLSSTERQRFKDIATRVSLIITSRTEHTTARFARYLVNDIPPEMIDEAAPLLREVVERDYYEHHIKRVEEGSARTVALVVDDAREYLADGAVVGG